MGLSANPRLNQRARCYGLEENGKPSINSSNPVKSALLQHGREKIGVVSFVLGIVHDKVEVSDEK